MSTIKRIVSRASDFISAFLGSSADAVALTNKTALENSAIRAAIAVIAEGVAQTPLNLVQTYQEDDLTRRRVLTTHPLARLLRKPNSYQSGFEFREMMTANALLGRGALAIKTIVGGEVRELHPVPYGSWEIQIADDGSQQFEVTFAGGIKQTYRQSETLYLHSLSLDGRSGHPTIDIARYAAGIASGFERQILMVASNGGRPTGIIKYTEQLDGARKENLVKTWKERFGAGGDGGVAVLDGDITYVPMDGVTAVEAQVVENRKFQIAEIARYFAINPAFLGDGTPITDALMRAHVKLTLRAWFVRWEQALARDLGLSDDLAFDFDEHELLRGDHASLGTWLTQMLGSGGTPGIMSVNECRYELGLDPISDEWAKKPLIGGYENSVAGATADQSQTQTDNTTDTANDNNA